MFAKIFERKWVIRFFGLALIIAPLFNTASSVLEIPNIEKKFLLAYCWQFFKSAPAPQQILQIASVIIGVLMLRGAISAWKYTLGLLGAYIILQFTQLNAGIRDNTTWLFLGTNVAFFFFIADQIVLKPRTSAPAATPASAEAAKLEAAKLEAAKTEPKVEAPVLVEASAMVEVATPNGSVFVAAATPASSAPAGQLAPVAPPSNVTPITSHQSAKKVYVNFEGFGNWATVSDISDAGIKVRAISAAPPEITSRTIELTLGAANLRLKFHQQDGAEYSFAFVALSSQDKQSLNQWLLTAAA